MAARPIRELDEPLTIWSIVSRIAGGMIVVLVVCSIAVPFFPRLKAYQELNEEGRIAEANRDRLKRIREDRQAELRMIETDPQYIELKAREHLDLHREGEVIFRFEPPDPR